jgi:hypothetical protein
MSGRIPLKEGRTVQFGGVMRKLAQVWRVLQVLRENPEGVTSEMIVGNPEVRGLYHKFGSRVADLRNHYGYNIPKAEKAHGEEWNYRWKLLHPEYQHPEERKALGMDAPPPAVKPYVDKTGNMNFDLGIAL